MENKKEFNFYNRKLKDISRKLRQNMTKAEAALWKYGLSKKQRKGYTFNRQRPVLNYVADFMCKKLSLIIEVDGASHNHERAQAKDRAREAKLEEAGFTILRFTNKDVLTNMDAVCFHIDKVIETLEK